MGVLFCTWKLRDIPCDDFSFLCDMGQGHLPED